MEPEKKPEPFDANKKFDKLEEKIGGSLKKSFALLKKAKAALQGDEAAQNDLAKTVADAQEKVEGAIDLAKVEGAKLAKKVENEINKRKPK